MKQCHFMKIYKKRWGYRIVAMVACGLITLGLIGTGIYTYNNNKNNAMVVKNIEDYKKALNNNSYIQISSDKLYDLDVVIKERRSKFGIKISENVKSKFVAIKLPPFTLGVAIPDREYKKLMGQKNGPYILKGHLIELKDNELTMLKSSMKNNTTLSEGFQLVPYLQYLQYEGPINEASIYFVLAALLIVFVLTLYIKIMRKNTVALKSLKNFSKGNIENTYKKIDDELNSSDVYKGGPITVTKNYVVVNTQQIVFALPLKELMWVYKETINKKAAFVIPAGKTNNIVFVFSDKRTYKIDLYKGDKIIDEVLEYISHNCPSCFVGYSKNLKDLLKKDADEFIFNWKFKNENMKNTCMTNEIKSENLSSNI